MASDRKENHIANIQALLKDYMIENNLIYQIDGIGDDDAHYDLHVWFNIKE